MKKLLAIIVAITLVLSLAACSGATTSQGSQDAEITESVDNKLGNYSVDIKNCRIAEDFEGKPIVIITYGFTNNGENSAAFYTSVSTAVFQNGIGLNECYFAEDSANYNSGNQSKEIKTGSTLDVEVAYNLNDTETDVEVEVTEWISFSDKKLTKTFSIK